ncbi:hypothetical protein MMC28_007637 [Mycoblastus sanguinarius]|nr:hypothetical protein [Mycoblastus sanguinarius]
MLSHSILRPILVRLAPGAPFVRHACKVPSRSSKSRFLHQIPKITGILPTPSNRFKQSLYEEFPDLYWQRELGPNKGCMHWGIAVGKGWYPIVRKVSSKLQAIVDRDGLEPRSVSFRQIKEKFGELRIYLDGETEEMETIVADAEEEAAKTCEDCGGEGYWQMHGWWEYTRCEECHEAIRVSKLRG